MNAAPLLSQRRARQALVASALVTVVLYVMPMGRLLGYPLMLLSTVVHELGHGIVALATGHALHQLAIYPDGSGVATHAGSADPVTRGLIAAGGLVGPAIASAAAFVLGRRAGLARVTLGVIAIAALLVTALFVRNPFGVAFVGVVGLGLGFIALRRPAWAQTTLVFLAVQLGLSVFSRADYLLVAQARTAAGTMPSDVAQIGLAWGGPYWVWGLVCGAFSIVVVALGVAWYTRFDRRLLTAETRR